MYTIGVTERGSDAGRNRQGERVCNQQANSGDKLEGLFLCLHSPNEIYAFPRVVEKKT